MELRVLANPQFLGYHSALMLEKMLRLTTSSIGRQRPVQRRLPLLIAAAAAAVAFALTSTAQAQSNTSVNLVLNAAAARPGDTVFAGIVMESAQNWHTYWRNPGESGAATKIEWTLPSFMTAGDIMWPPPEEHVAGGLTTYVYHGKTMLIVPLFVSSNAIPGQYEVTAKVDWLECYEECVPGESTTKARLEIATERRATPDADQINDWLKRIPSRYPNLDVISYWNQNPAGDDLNELVIIVGPNTNIQPANFLVYPIDGVEVLPAVQLETTAQGETRLLKKVKLYGAGLPQTLTGILWRPGKDREHPVAVEVELKPASSSRTAATTMQPTTASGAAHVAPGIGALLAMLGLAFLGGLILNIMPCVLPVISLKILGFVQQSKESPGRVKRMGLMYGLGVVFSFLVLAGIVIAVQKAGGAASWGMQMQNPYFRFALLLVVTLVALNLFGLFEVGLGAAVPGAASSLAKKGGALGAFSNGVLATALATPCTAPFLTAALGFAFAQSSSTVILLIFTSAAIGLASPYVLLSWQPAWLRFLPKPGPWMERFKVAMGFPMLATAVWLFDLTAPSFGDGGILWLGLLLVLVGVAAWVWGEFIQRSIGQRKIAPRIAVLICLAACGAILEGPLDWRHLNEHPATVTARQNTKGGIDWQPWSREAVEKARAEGHPVLVDFTARWCLTCKSNEKFAIETSEVREKLRLINAVAFKADNTDPNPEITAELKKHGRAGVPLVVVYPRRSDQPPIVLPTVLTPGLVLDALELAGK